MPKPSRVVHILVSGQPPEHSLSQHPDQRVMAVLAGARVGEYIAGHRGKAQRGVQFPVREQADVGGDHRSSKLEHQPAVEIESENLGIRFTRRVRHDSLTRSEITC
jgi:hypothetical protein